MSAQSQPILYSVKLLGIRKLNNPAPAVRTQDNRIYLGVHHTDAWKTASEPDRYQIGFYNADTRKFSSYTSEVIGIFGAKN
jgi:hypothetical protein